MFFFTLMAALKEYFIPTGENGILLVVRQNWKEVVERITLTIVAQEVR
jgi:hypothetical protein